jgi:hypothetical protein
MVFYPLKKTAFPGFVASVACTVEAKIACQYRISII